jgi:hypothetical protein
MGPSVGLDVASKLHCDHWFRSCIICCAGCLTLYIALTQYVLNTRVKLVIQYICSLCVVMHCLPCCAAVVVRSQRLKLPCLSCCCKLVCPENCGKQSAPCNVCCYEVFCRTARRLQTWPPQEAQQAAAVLQHNESTCAAPFTQRDDPTGAAPYTAAAVAAIATTPCSPLAGMARPKGWVHLRNHNRMV